MKKIKTVNNIDHNYCTGCSACYSVCPEKAIELCADNEGFKFPIIDWTKCTDCGMCYKVCPLNKEKNKSEYIPKAYAMQNLDNSILQKSSSGGVFYELAKKTLKENGIVYGCAMVNNTATHIRVTDEEELFSILGSKYVQSDVNCFSDVKKDLQSGHNVLFCGTPCHIAGLKSYLKKEYKNLLCIDFICHGVPSPKVLQKYIVHCNEDKNIHIDGVRFRSKKFGWSRFAMELTSDGNEVLCEPRNENIYLKAFLSNVTIRKSCGNCRFNVLPRQADITLGDFWNGKLMNADAERGLSLAVANSEKGMLAINGIQDEFLKKEISIEDIKKGNPFIDGHCKLSKRRKTFFKKLDCESIVNNMEKNVKPTFMEWIKEVVLYKTKRMINVTMKLTKKNKKSF